MSNATNTAAVAFILLADLGRMPNEYMVSAHRAFAADLPIWIVEVNVSSPNSDVDSFALVAADNRDDAQNAARVHYCDELYAGDWKIGTTTYARRVPNYLA